MAQQPQPQRNQAVEFFRVAAIVAVIAIHTRPLERPGAALGTTLDGALLINQLARFAVPFFFIVSGYFWAAKVRGGPFLSASTWVSLRRIGVIFLFWSAAYLLLPRLLGIFSDGVALSLKKLYWDASTLASHPWRSLLGGTESHLWYLPALMLCMLISALALHCRLAVPLAVLAVVLYGAGLLGKAYADTALGFDSGFNLRNGPFFGLIFFVTGYTLQQRQSSPRWIGMGCALALAGLLVQLAEVILLHRFVGTSLLQDFTIGTYFFGLGVALIALANPAFLHGWLVPKVAPGVLIIYCVHYFFITWLAPLHSAVAFSAATELLYLAAVFLLSLAVAKLLARVPAARRLQ